MEESGSPAPNPVKLQFHYIKNSDFREVPCHGVLGGPTPSGQIWMAIFSERGPIPKTVEFTVPASEVNASGIVFDEAAARPSRVESREGVIRSVSIGMYMDVETARRLHEWLGRQLQQTSGQ